MATRQFDVPFGRIQSTFVNRDPRKKLTNKADCPGALAAERPEKGRAKSRSCLGNTSGLQPKPAKPIAEWLAKETGIRLTSRTDSFEKDSFRVVESFLSDQQDGRSFEQLDLDFRDVQAKGSKVRLLKAPGRQGKIPTIDGEVGSVPECMHDLSWFDRVVQKHNCSKKAVRSMRASCRLKDSREIMKRLVPCAPIAGPSRTTGEIEINASRFPPFHPIREQDGPLHFETPGLLVRKLPDEFVEKRQSPRTRIDPPERPDRTGGGDQKILAKGGLEPPNPFFDELRRLGGSPFFVQTKRRLSGLDTTPQGIPRKLQEFGPPASFEALPASVQKLRGGRREIVPNLIWGRIANDPRNEGIAESKAPGVDGQPERGPKNRPRHPRFLSFRSSSQRQQSRKSPRCRIEPGR